MKSKRARKTSSVLKSGFETDQPLKVGHVYRFVYTEGPGLPEQSMKAWFIKEHDGVYYVVPDMPRALLIDRVVEVNEILQ